MLQNVGDLITEVLVRNNRTTTDGFITDAVLQDWTREANSWVTGFHKWPFTEARDQTLAWSGSEEIGYSSFNVSYKSDSIRMLRIGDKRLKKINFSDYLTMREDTPDSNERVYSDYNRVVYINPRADVSGTIAAFGQYAPSIDPTDLTANTVFSTFDQEGNEAYVEKMTSYLKRREHLPNEAELHDQRAAAKLNELWQKILDEQAMYQPGPTSQGMFKRIDMLHGDLYDETIKRDQW